MHRNSTPWPTAARSRFATARAAARRWSFCPVICPTWPVPRRPRWPIGRRTRSASGYCSTTRAAARARATLPMARSAGGARKSSRWWKRGSADRSSSSARRWAAGSCCLLRAPWGTGSQRWSASPPRPISPTGLFSCAEGGARRRRDRFRRQSLRPRADANLRPLLVRRQGAAPTRRGNSVRRPGAPSARTGRRRCAAGDFAPPHRRAAFKRRAGDPRQGRRPPLVARAGHRPPAPHGGCPMTGSAR